MKKRIKKFNNILSCFFAIFISLFFICCGDSGYYALKIKSSKDMQFLYNTYESRVSQRFVKNSEFSTLGLTGEYSGNAIEFSEPQLAYSNNNYMVKLNITQEKYESIKKEGYEKLYLWLCVVYTGNEDVYLTSANDALLSNTITVGKEKQNKWFQAKIYLTAKLKEKLFDEKGNAKTLPLLSTYFYKTEIGQHITLYVGDIGFC